MLRIGRACRAASALPLLAALGCQSVVVPGLVRGGANRPPAIVVAQLERTPSQFLKLSATVVEPDADGLVIRYEQLAGPTAVPRSTLTVGGAYSVLFDAPADVAYSFRIIASDGFFDATADVTLDAGGRTATAATTRSGRRPVPTGRFDVRFSGRTVAAEGLASFALDGTIELAEPAGDGSNPVVIALTTDALPDFPAAPPGALLLRSVADAAWMVDVHSGSASVLARLTPSQPLMQTLDVALFGGEIVASVADAASLAGGVSPGRFRTADTGTGAYSVASALLRLRIDGERIAGELYLSSRATAVADLPRFHELSAQIVGSRGR